MLFSISPHIINLQDNERIFGTDLQNATHFTISCSDPTCKKPYEQERTIKFTFPGTYYYEITMQTDNAVNIYSHYPEIEVFKVLNYDEQLEIDANQILISTQTNDLTLETEPSKDELTPLYVIGALTSIIALVITLPLVWVQYFSHYNLKSIFKNFFHILKIILKIPSMIYYGGKSVSVKSTKILGKNSQYSGLYDIEATLNKTPDEKWVQFYNEFGTQDISVGKPPISGNKITARCSESLIERNFKWIRNYVSQSNNQYITFMKKKKEEERMQKEKAKMEKEKLKKLRDTFD